LTRRLVKGEVLAFASAHGGAERRECLVGGPFRVGESDLGALAGVGRLSRFSLRERRSARGLPGDRVGEPTGKCHM
jgi:hypothetical protein